MKILALLTSCINPENRMSSVGSKRLDQYKNGFNSFFKHMDFFLLNNMDIVLTDNSCTEYHPELLPLIPENVKTRYLIRNTGSINKGVGLIGQWIDCKDIIEQYDYVIHFEPRQELLNLDMINNFISNPSSLFTINSRSKTFNTGLIIIESTILLNYINNVDCKQMEKKRISIEYDMHRYMSDKMYRITDKMNILWFDGNRTIEM